jgi:hypothetical protein
VLILHQAVNGQSIVRNFKGVIRFEQSKKLRTIALTTICVTTSIERIIYSKNHFVLGLDYANTASSCEWAINRSTFQRGY